jgi:hypothetical protein
MQGEVDIQMGVWEYVGCGRDVVRGVIMIFMLETTVSFHFLSSSSVSVQPYILLNIDNR